MTYFEAQRERAAALQILINDVKGALDPRSEWYETDPRDREASKADLVFLTSQMDALIDSVRTSVTIASIN
jgi:hypothetical protein